jgi:hypothetical protein
MNQVFDFQRWLLLTGKHWSENRKKYLLSMVAMLALLIIWYSFVLLIERMHPYPEEMQVTTYYIGLAIVGCLYGSMLFGDLASGPKAMHHLSVPASHLEKLMCGLFYGIVLFFVCYTALFYLVDFTMVKIANGILEKFWREHDPSHVWSRFKVANVFARPQGAESDFPNIYFYFLVIYFNLQSAFILGSIYFAGYSFIKTCISLLVVFLIMVFYIANVADSIMPRGTFYEGFFAYRIAEEGPVERGAKFADWLSATLKFLFMYGFLPILWLATYFRLKEKEV